MKFSVNRHTDALLALSHAESSGKLYLIGKTVLSDKLLKSLHHSARAFDMT